MKRFLVTYLAPASVIADWKKTDPAQRKDAETKMQVLSRFVLELGDAISGISRVPSQAARSIG
jgi:hypothetical protein